MISFQISDIVLYLFVFITLIQLLYFWGIFGKLAFYKNKDSKSNFQVLEPISVVIAARNEYANLQNNLILILEQDYPEFEVVVVNDASTDDTIDLLKELSQKYAHLSPINLEENKNFYKGKKLPLSVGIKSAKYNGVLLTDADCKPEGKKWIKSMASGFSDQKQLLLGYGPYEYQKGFLNTLIRFETFVTALQYLSYALNKMAYMGVGRNLAYQKELFYANKGFQNHYKVASGDDDLFVNQATNKYNTDIIINKESFTYSVPNDNFSDWWRQKQRHLSTGKFYRFQHKLLLATFSISSILFFGLFIFLLAYQHEVFLVLGLFFLRFLSQFIIYNKTLNLLHEKKLLVFSPLLELLLLLMQPVIFFTSLLKKKNRWK